MSYVTYESVTNWSTTTVPGGTLKAGTCKPYTYPSHSFKPRVGTQRTYLPYVERKRLYDPSKGRSFRALKESGAIAMSPYVNETEIIRRLVSDCDYTRRKDVFSYAWCSLPSYPTCTYAGPTPMYETWTESDDLSSLLSRSVPELGSWYKNLDEEIADMISSTQQQAFSDALNAYDLLTELGEIRETLSYLLGKVGGGADLLNKLREKDHDTYRRGRHLNAKQLLKSGDAALRKLGGRWMEYRYAIMPLVYSFKDVHKLLNPRGDRYHSERAKGTIDVSTPRVSPGSLSECILYETSGRVVVRSLTKARYDLGSLQRLANAVGLNPFRTAWELIPLSFVVDWFINTGDAITALTGLDYASTRSGCTSVRASINDTAYHYVRRSTENHLSFTTPCGVVPGLEVISGECENLIYDRKLEGYQRTLWSRPIPQLQFDPFLNWKRFIDGLVLGYQPIRKILRSLK